MRPAQFPTEVAWHQSSLCLALPEGAGGQQATATTSWITMRSIPSSAAKPLFDRLCNALEQADIGLILDFVPNHMGIHYADNPWWLDVLEWGPKSPHAASFDTRLAIPARAPHGGVLDSDSRKLVRRSARGRARSSFDMMKPKAVFSAWYYEHRLPIDPGRYGQILQRIVAEADAGDTPARPQLLEFAARHRGPHNPPRDQAPAFKVEAGRHRRTVMS